MAKAVELTGNIIARSEGPLLIDVPDRQTDMTRMLKAAGFTRERGFRRMYLGEPDTAGDASLIYAIAGPELG